MTVDTIILAAGKGSRMKSELPKVLQPLAGKPLLEHVISAAKSLDDSNILTIIGHGSETVKATINEDCQWILQEEQLGTGHAVKQALPYLHSDGIALILYGDVPLVKQETLEAMVKIAKAGDVALLTVNLENPAGYGRIVRNEAGNVVSIVEQKDATEEQLQITECNTGILALNNSYLQSMLPELSNDNAQKEYYLTDVIKMSVDQGIQVTTVMTSDEMEVQGVNDKIQLAALERSYQKSQAYRLMTEGVTLLDPSRIDIRGTLEVGRDVLIDVNCVFQGHVTLGNNVTIAANCVIGEAGTYVSIGDNVEIKANSIIEEAEIAENCVIGPYARLRPGTRLSAKAKIGNFVETKKSVIGEGSKVNHLTYIGDAEIGKGVNVGAGTITCNYDGVNKHKTVIEDNAFIGSNTAIVAPVTIKETATIAAGSTVTKDVEDHELAIARAKQKNIKGWPRPQKSPTKGDK